jgi:hypothetical protein
MVLILEMPLHPDLGQVPLDCIVRPLDGRIPADTSHADHRALRSPFPREVAMMLGDKE